MKRQLRRRPAAAPGAITPRADASISCGERFTAGAPMRRPRPAPTLRTPKTQARDQRPPPDRPATVAISWIRYSPIAACGTMNSASTSQYSTIDRRHHRRDHRPFRQERQVAPQRSCGRAAPRSASTTSAAHSPGGRCSSRSAIRTAPPRPAAAARSRAAAGPRPASAPGSDPAPASGRPSAVSGSTCTNRISAAPARRTARGRATAARGDRVNHRVSPPVAGGSGTDRRPGADQPAGIGQRRPPAWLRSTRRNSSRS